MYIPIRPKNVEQARISQGPGRRCRQIVLIESSKVILALGIFDGWMLRINSGYRQYYSVLIHDTGQDTTAWTV
nr:hypothetical protein CFP56_52908 [Quercus suber]